MLLCAIAWDTARLIPFDGVGGVVAKGAVVATVTVFTMLMVFPNVISALRDRKAK